MAEQSQLPPFLDLTYGDDQEAPKGELAEICEFLQTVKMDAVPKGALRIDKYFWLVTFPGAEVWAFERHGGAWASERVYRPSEEP